MIDGTVVAIDFYYLKLLLKPNSIRIFSEICKMTLQSQFQKSCFQTDFFPIIALFPKYPVVVAVEHTHNAGTP